MEDEVILVQVNPGETFTIRTEDGHIQCIQGPAHVPMVSPNGSVPPIFVPPGYVSQRSKTQCQPLRYAAPQLQLQERYRRGTAPTSSVRHCSHSPGQKQHWKPEKAGPPQQSPPFAVGRGSGSRECLGTQMVEENGVRKVVVLPHSSEFHPSMHPPPPHVPHYMHPHPALLPHPPHPVYSPVPGTGEIPPQFIHQPPPPAHVYQEQESRSHGRTNFIQRDERTVKMQEHLKKRLKERQASGHTNNKLNSPPSSPHKVHNSSSTNVQNGYGNGKGQQAACGVIKQKQIGKTRASPPADSEMGAKKEEINGFPEVPCYCSKGVSATSSSIKESVSELVSFTTESCEPDPPAAPKLINRTKNSLSLHWKSSNDNGSKITNFLLEWDEGKSGAFKECYYGNLKQYKLTKLSPSTKYLLRLAAKNDIGMSEFSETVIYYTAGIVPSPPLPPELTEAGVTWLSLKWSPPNGMPSDDSLTYTLDMEEDDSGYGFQPKYNGEELSCTLQNLRRSTPHKFRLCACNNEGKSIPSEVVEYSTIPDKPGPPSKPSVKGKIHSHNVKVTWDPPKDNGGSDISKYFLEISETLIGTKWEVVYSGSVREHVCDHLKPGISYKLRVYCVSKGGESPFGPLSEKAEISTAAGPPDQCSTPLLTCKAATCVVVTWEAVNIAGVGLFGGIGVVTTPASVPAAVSVLHLLEEDQMEIPCPLSTCLAIQWEEPCCHGSDVIGYNIEYGEKQLVTVGRVTSHILENLHPDTLYRIRIQAINNFGVGPFNHSIKAKTKPLPPDPPHLECVVFSYQSLKLKWGEGPGRALITNPTQFNLQMEDRFGRFVTVYSGPCHTYKVQRLSESTTYYFKIQAYNDAGEGEFSEVYAFTTTKSPPASLKAPKVNQVRENICEITWEPLQSMKGDSIVYILQLASVREVDQVYKGSETSFRFTNFQTNCEYRFRVCAGRQYQDSTGLQELYGPYSPSTVFSSQKQELVPQCTDSTAKFAKIKKTLSDEQFAFLLLVGFAMVAILFAFVIQYFVIK
ncbi:Fibronectin type-III domain-containing protein 3A [Chelonia mydas]|uniref:Fibronectin type-III domain-containing protein 3A n=1 Tax=Chelonia mydas TaxID=8469 RepID=M7C6A5_CHEMY|nr:Fibronectin type-III domain-containing protein 3A [Chelonia mydas]